MDRLHRVAVMGAKDSFQSSNLKEKIYIWLRFCDIILESFSVSLIVKISSFPIKECAVLNSPIRMMVNASENVIKWVGFLNRSFNKWSNETVSSTSCLPLFFLFLPFLTRIRKSTFILCFSVHVLRLLWVSTPSSVIGSRQNLLSKFLGKIYFPSAPCDLLRGQDSK